MIPQFSVTVDGVEMVLRGFNRLERIDDFRPLWGNVIGEFHQIEAEQFMSEGAAGGAKWAPLKKPYADYKEVAYPGQPILQATSELRESLIETDALGAVVRPGQEELVIGTSIPYGLFHQRGTRRGLPRRPPINLSEAQKRRIQKSIQKGLVQFVRNGIGGN